MVIIFRKLWKPLPRIVTTFPIPRQTVCMLHLLTGKQKATGFISSFLPLFLPFSPYFSLPLSFLFLSSSLPLWSWIKPTEWSMLEAGWISPSPCLPGATTEWRRQKMNSSQCSGCSKTWCGLRKHIGSFKDPWGIKSSFNQQIYQGAFSGKFLNR